MRFLIVKLASLGDVVHAIPVVHDILAVHPDAVIDWVVEPAFAPLLRRVQGLHEVIECPMQRWRGAWWTAAVRAEWRALRARLQRERYDAVIDLQGRTESAVVARMANGLRFGPANGAEGSAHDLSAGWLVDHAIRIDPRIHMLDRSRVLVAQVLARPAEGPPRYGLQVPTPARRSAQPTVAFVHGSSHDDGLWPQQNWVLLGKRVIGAGWRIGLPQGNEAEQTGAEMIAAGLQYEGSLQVDVWPTIGLGAVLERLAAVQGVIGVDGALSRIAVALELPHVQLHTAPTAWRSGPLPQHGRPHQVALEGRSAATLESVWAAWAGVLRAAEG